MGVSILLVRLLHREPYGKLTIVQSTIGLIGTFAGMGMGETAIKYLAEFRDKDRLRAGRIVGIVNVMAFCFGSAMSIAAFVFSGYLAQHVLHAPELAALLRIASLLPLVATLDGIQVATLNGLEAFRLIARRSVWGAAAALPISAAFVWLWGLKGAVAAQLIAAVVNLLLSATASASELARQGISWHLGRGALAEWRVLYRYSLPALAASLMVAPVMWIANVMLFRGHNGAAYVAAVGVVNSVMTIVAYLPTVLTSPALSVMSNSAHRPMQLASTLRYSLSLSALAAFPIGVVVATLGKYLLVALYGPQFAEEGIDLAWAMIYVGIQAIGAPLGNMLLATGRIWLGLGINAMWSAIFLAMCAWLIPGYHSAGYFSSLAISYMVLDVIVYATFLYREPEIWSGYPVCRVLFLYWAFIGLASYLGTRLPLAAAFVAALLLCGFLAGILLLIARHLHRRDVREAAVMAAGVAV